MVGDAPYASSYRKAIDRLARDVDGVILTGYQFGDAYRELQSNCQVYVQATEVGGTHPALVEAMGRGAPIVATDVPEHREVLGDAGVYFDRGSASSLAQAMAALGDDESRRHSLGRRARSRALAKYSWDSVTARLRAPIRVAASSSRLIVHGASEPEVIVLSQDLSANAVGRAVVFADLLRGARAVAIVGWSSGGIHPLVDGRGLRVEREASRVVPSAELRERLSRATVIASKPSWRSFGWALGTSRRVILDIDDPELALLLTDLRTLVRSSLTLGSPPITAVLQALRGRAAGLTVSSQALEQRYGGTVIPHARDAAFFTDEVRARAAARTRLGLPAHRRLVAFVGTARAHKGISDFLSAASGMSTVDFAVVGAAGDGDHPPSSRNVRYVPSSGVCRCHAVGFRCGRDRSPTAPRRNRTRTGASQAR